MINNKHYLSTVDYHSKFLVMKQAEVLNIDNLMNICKKYEKIPWN